MALSATGRTLLTPRLLIAFNKPFGVLCKFRRESDPARRTLADFIDVPHVHPAGRLDADSEGLLLLTDDGALQARIAEPKHKLAKLYWAQVEGVPTGEALRTLRSGVDLGEFTTLPALDRGVPIVAIVVTLAYAVWGCLGKEKE